MKYRLSQKVKSLWIDAKEYWSFKSPIKFLVYFLAGHDRRFDQLDLTLNVFDIQDEEIPIAGPGEINVMTCVENCIANTHYAHHTKYGDYGDPNIHVYLYNHIDKLVKTDKYIAIPMIWIRLAYFRHFYETIRPSHKPTKEQQAFGILLSANWRNADTKKNISEGLGALGRVYNMNQFRNRMYFESCWFTELFVNFVSNFRFVIVCENSEAPGYITEKIFKPFFARSIPIYWGNEPEKYFQEGSFINAKALSSEQLIARVKELAEDEDKYNEMINHPKIRPEADFDYLGEFIKFVQEKAGLEVKNNV